MSSVALAILFSALSIKAQPGTGTDDEPAVHADQLYEQRNQRDKCEQAVRAFEQLLQDDPGNTGYLEKLTHLYFWQGAHCSLDEQPKRKRCFLRGIKTAERLIEQDSTNPAGYFWKATCMGVIARDTGIMKSLFVLKPVLDLLRKVEELDDTYNYGGVYRYYSQLYLRAPRLLGGDPKKAVEMALKAVQIEPRLFTNRYFLAKAYLKSGEKQKAIAQLRYIVETPADVLEDREAENTREKASARRLLKELTKEDP